MTASIKANQHGKIWYLHITSHFSLSPTSRKSWQKSTRLMSARPVSGMWTPPPPPNKCSILFITRSRKFTLHQYSLHGHAPVTDNGPPQGSRKLPFTVPQNGTGKKLTLSIDDMLSKLNWPSLKNWQQVSHMAMFYITNVLAAIKSPDLYHQVMSTK